MASGLTIRPATADDIAEIDALLARSYPALLKGAYPPSLLVTAIPLISKAQPKLVVSGTYFVVEEGGQVLGAGGWTAEAPSGGQVTCRLGHIRHVVTDHRQIRRGVGRALMGYIIEDARKAGMTRLECMSTLMAEPFYRACGFETHEKVSIALRPGIDFPAVRMEMNL